MILTVTLNPALDRVVNVASFRPGKVNLIEKERIRIAGGKGINVSRVVKTLGERTLATGWLGGSQGRIIKRNLDKENIDTDFVFIKEESRLNLTILDPVSDKKTHLVEEGPLISYPEIKNLKEKLKSLAGRANIVVFSGSIPRGVGEGIYNSLV
ncbi:1-phosphofructokinase, partial [Candidatus Aerophobetes bacterium Ae_b3a]